MMVEGDGLQKKGFGWRTGARLCSSLSPLPSPLLRTPAPPLTRPVHRARRGACVPPASRHLEQTRNIKSAQPQITCERSKVTTDKYAKTQTILQNKSRDVRMRIRVHKHTERLQTLRGCTSCDLLIYGASWKISEYTGAVNERQRCHSETELV